MKKHRVNRIMTFILVLALSVSTLLIGCGKNNDKIVLGWIGPLTGENTIWGTAEMQALTMAVEDTNAAGGLLGKEVNVIPVPTTDTPLLRATLSQEMIQREIDVTPMKRIATTEDIADTVLFLVSDAARYITGQIIAPNGGRRMLV